VNKSFTPYSLFAPISHLLRSKKFYKSFGAILCNLSLLLNNFLPFFAVRAAYAADYSSVSSITYSESSHQLNIIKDGSSDIAYQLFYKSDSKIDSIAGSSLPSSFYLGTCSSGDCLSQNFDSAVLKIKTDSSFYYYYFTLNNGQTNIIKQGDSSQFDLTDTENTLLENGLDNSSSLSWTFEKVELNKEYFAPQNSGIKLIFTKLPESSGNIKIEEITLTPEQIKQTGSLSDKAYDITSDMADGSFAYNLSLPIPESSKGKSVDVKYTEDISQIDSAQKVDNTTNSTDSSVSVTNLDHFTIFVVTTPSPVNSDCSGASVGIVGTDKCFNTIQAAIGAAINGDTINVAAGTYIENITINKSITLQGADKTTTIIDGGNSGVVVLVSSTNNVIINGFTIKNSGSDINQHAGIGLVGVSNVTIENNIITNNVTGVAVMSSSNNNIKNNEIKNSARYGIVLEKHPSIPSFSTLNTVSGNTLTANARDGIYAGQDCNSNTITNNSISGATGTTEGSFEANGLYLWKSASNTITGNTITNNVAFGIEMYGSKENIVTGNEITGNLDGFHIRNIDEATGYSIRNNNISNNKIYGNTRVNLYGSPNFDFNIENNWWGSADKTTIVNKLASWTSDGNITPGTTVYLDYTPWCANSTCTTFSSANNAVTKTASSITSTDAILNGTNGDYDASGHSFWVSLSPFVTTSPSIPSGVYSTPVLSSLNANDNFSSSLSSITTSGVPNNLPSITPNTTYYFAAWSEVNGTWYPGEVKSFTTLVPPDITNPTATIDGVTPKSLYGGSTSINVHAIDSNYLKTELYRNSETSPFKTYTGSWFGLSWLADGNYRMVVIDNSNNSTEYVFTIDKTAPSIPVGGTPDNLIKNTNNFDFNWNNSTDSSSPITYEFQSSLNSAQTGGVLTTGLWHSNILPSNMIHSSGAPDGIWYWQVRAIDDAGNKSAWSEIWDVTIDKTAPVLDSQTTFSGWYTANKTSVFNYTDSLSGIASGNPVSCVINTQGTNKTCSVTPNVCDNVGNCNITPVTSNGANIDKSNPTGAWINPVEGQHVSGTVDLSVSANDTISGLDFVRLRYGVDTSHLITLIDDSIAPYGTTWNTAGLSNGNYVLRARVQDKAGKYKIEDINVVVDNIVPTITSVSSDGATYNLASANPAIKIAFNEDISNPPTVEMFSPVGDLQTVNDCSDSDAKTFCFTYSLNNEETTHTIHIYGAQDAAGNTMSLNTAHTFVVDRIAPIFVSSTPFDGWYNTNQTSTFNYSGSISGNDFTCDITTEGPNQTCTVTTPNVCDAAGNCNITPATSNPANVDFTDPTSTIDGGVNNGKIYSSNWNGFISGTASDLASGIKEVQLTVQKTDGQYWNGSTWQVGETRVVAIGTTNWTYQIGATLTDGTYTLKSHAIDNAGNTENTYTLTIVLDKTINEVALSIDPTVGDASNGWYKTQPTVTLTQTDDNFDRIEYQWDSQVDGSWTEYLTPFKLTNEGAHVLYYRAVDLANNISAIGVKNIAWDQTDLEYGPQNISANPNPTSGSTSKIRWDVAKDNIGIDKYEVQWSLNSINYSKTVGAGTTEVEIDQLTEGKWTVKVIAFDQSGRTKDGSIDLNVDRTGPVAPVLTLTGTGVGTATLVWNAIADAKDYIVWYGNSPGSRIYGARVGNVTSYTVKGLGAGNYYFIVKAVDEAQNQGAESNEVNTGAIAGAAGVATGTPAQGFTSQVLGAATELTPTPTLSPSLSNVLGISTKNMNYLWWLLSILPFSFVLWLILKKKRN
jgi:parallel beta-helix repeat protein